MKIDARCFAPGTIDVTISITMQLSEWEQLVAELSKNDWPASFLREQTVKILDKLKRTVTLTGDWNDALPS